MQMHRVITGTNIYGIFSRKPEVTNNQLLCICI